MQDKILRTLGVLFLAIALLASAIVVGAAINRNDTPTASADGSTGTTDTASNGATASNKQNTGTMPDLPVDASHGTWTINETANIDDDPIVRDWLTRLQDPNPSNWETFPNIPNPEVPEFRVVNGDQVPDGAEYGVANVPFCQQDMRCDFVVPANHYRLITADYEFQGMRCVNNDANQRRGCLLLLINVGGETMIWRNQIADNGFSVPGRYWNGDALEWATWGLVSHASANMLGMPTTGLEGEILNAGDGTNAGTNCGVPEGCPSVDATIVVHAGDRILATAHSNITG